MKNRPIGRAQDRPLLYYKTKEEIEAYRKKPVKYKLQWLEAQMEFFHKAMPDKAKRIRSSLKETVAIRSDTSLGKEIKKGLKALNSRKARLYTLDELFD